MMAFMRDNSLKLVKTSILIFTWFARGFAASLIGATMPDLRTRFGTDAAGISYALSIGKTGALVGSLMAGFLDRYGAYYDLICGGLTSILCLVTIVMTSSTYLWLFTLCKIIDEFAWSILAPGGDSMIIKMWGDNSGPYIQALTLGFPIGATIGPLVASVFVSENTTSSGNTTTNTFHGIMDYNFLIAPNVFNDYDTIAMPDTYDDDRFPDDSQIQFAYYIAGLLMLLCVFAFLVFHAFFHKESSKHIPKATFKWKEIFSPKEWTEGEKLMGLLMLTFMVLFFIAHDQQYDVVSVYVTSYAVDSDLGFSNEEAARISSLLQLTGSVSRFIAIFTSYWISAKLLFIFHVNAGAISFLLLAIFGPDSKTNLLVFVSVFGFLFRPLRGVTYTFLNIYIVLISNILGIVRFGSAFSAIFLQALHGYLYENTVIESIFYIGVIYGCIYVIMHALMLLLGRIYGTLDERRKAKTEDTSFNVLSELKVDPEKPCTPPSDSMVERRASLDSVKKENDYKVPVNYGSERHTSQSNEDTYL